MRTEDDLRAALATLECHAPDALAVLAAVRTTGAARHVINRRRWSRSLLAAAATVSVAAATALSAGLLRPATGTGPAATSGAAAVLRQLAVDAAAQPVPALGPVLYTKDAFWVSGDSSQLHGLFNRAGDPYIERDWVSAAARFITAPDQHSGLAPGQVPSSYTKLDPENNPYWNWLDPATLPADPAALRQRLLSGLAGMPAARIGGTRATPDQTLFSAALELMSSEPLRPAVRASMLRLIAGIAQRSPREFAVLGTVTDRAGHRDVAIAWQSQKIWSYPPIQYKWKLLHTSSTELAIFLFDPVSGALRAGEYATCTGPVSTVAMANARCALESYEQYLVIKAVRTLPKGASGSRSSRLVPYVFFAPWQPFIR